MENLSYDNKFNKKESENNFLEYIKVFPVSAQVEILQVVNSLRLVAEITVIPEFTKTMIPAIEKLKNKGFKVAQCEIDGIKDFFVSKDGAMAEETKNIMLLDRNKVTLENQKRFGELMGYPPSAIEAFLLNDKENLLSDEDVQKLIGFKNHMFHLKFSKAHPEDAVEYLKKSYKILLEQAPNLIDRSFSDEEYKIELKQKIAKFVYGQN